MMHVSLKTMPDRELTSPGGNGTLELVCLFGQLAGDGFRLGLSSFLGSKALSDGKGIHVLSTQEVCTVIPHEIAIRQKDNGEARGVGDQDTRRNGPTFFRDV